MQVSTSILDIPLLLEMVCDRLKPIDIRNCASCSKAWYTNFGPYRFRNVRLNSPNVARTMFFLDNSRHIRGLQLDMTDFEFFANNQCTRLRTLSLSFAYEMNEETDDDSSDELDGVASFHPLTTRPNIYLCAAELIRKNQKLGTLHHGRGFNGPRRHIAEPILHAIASHPFLTTLRITMKIFCSALLETLCHLPQQLQEFRVNGDVDAGDNHPEHCDTHARVFGSQESPLGIRRLLFVGVMPCLVRRCFTLMLRRCPELEELTFPSGSGVQESGMTDVLKSHCKRLHTINQEQCPIRSSDSICAILQGSSEGIRELRLLGVEWFNGDCILQRIMTTATLNTIEVVRICPRINTGDITISVLANCPRLKEFTSIGEEPNSGVELFDLLSSMFESWRCWPTLEVLSLEVLNMRMLERYSDEDMRRRGTAESVRKLFFCLRAIPKLTTLNLRWTLMANDLEPCPEFSLQELNEGAVNMGTTLMTLDDMKWIKLRQ